MKDSGAARWVMVKLKLESTGRQKEKITRSRMVFFFIF